MHKKDCSDNEEEKTRKKLRQEEKNWWVYMIQTVSGKLYTGITTDVERRYFEHAGHSAKSAKFFRSDAPKALVYQERVSDRSEASRRESEIKKMGRQSKLKLAGL